MVVANDEDSVRVELGNRKEVKKLKTMNVTRDFKPKLSANTNEAVFKP